MGYSASTAKTFISQIAPLIQSEAKKRGYLVCSPVISQAIIESAAGTSSLGYKYHNYFGLKCGSSWKGKSVNLSTKEEYKVGTLTTIKDNFRVYDTMAAGVAGYFDFISTKRYMNLKGATTALDYLTKIKADGYATSSTYVSSNMSVVTKYGLTSWDDFKSGNPYKEPLAYLSKGCSGDGVRWLQWQLTHRGYSVTIDGLFGEKTLQAVCAFQADQTDRMLIVDGIVGPATKEALNNG